MWASLAPGSAVPRARGPLGTHPSHGNSRARLPLRASSASDDAPIAVPHSGYHRTVGVPRTFFEGWYFRVTLPESRDNLSLIYHVYDPDLPDSPRRAAGAQVCAPGGGYLFRESKDVDAFRADPHALELRMPLEPGVGVPTPDPARPAEPHHLEPEFYEVSEGGARHRGRLTRDPSRDDPAVWPPSKRVSVVEWDFRVRPVAGYGGDRERPQISTAGWLSALPVFEPHYQVLLAHGLATGWVETDGVRAGFRDSPAYAEKIKRRGVPREVVLAPMQRLPDPPGAQRHGHGCEPGRGVAPRGARGGGGGDDTRRGWKLLPFVPAGSDPAEVRWEVAPWGSWRVTAETSTHEVEITATIEPKDVVPGGTTVLRAPVDDPKRGMAPSCRESFRGTMRTSLWEREGRGWGSGARGRCILDAVASDVAAVEVGGGGPWEEDWVGNAEMREPLGTLAGTDVDVRAVADFFKPLGDVVPGL